jgi:hypothetical protein
VDEIGTHAETVAARTIAQRGVQLVATAHGGGLSNLLKNPSLCDLVRPQPGFTPRRSERRDESASHMTGGLCASARAMDSSKGDAYTETLLLGAPWIRARGTRTQRRCCWARPSCAHSTPRWFLAPARRGQGVCTREVSECAKDQ